MTAGLDRTYSQKAVQIKGAPTNARLYITTSGSQLDSLVEPGMSMHDESQSPVVFQTYGKGRVGFVGDVNAETGTTKAILAMCGLTSTTTPPVVIAGTSDPEAGGLYCSDCGQYHYPTQPSTPASGPLPRSPPSPAPPRPCASGTAPPSPPRTPPARTSSPDTPAPLPTTARKHSCTART